MKKSSHAGPGGQPSTAYIVHPVHPSARGTEVIRSTDAMLEEAKGLARAIELQVLQVKTVQVPKINPAHYIGSGNRDVIAAEIEQLKPDVVIFNHALSPGQQRNLEKAWNAKVIDRTGLILEIFSARAQTKEGRLQVELAQLDYQRSRLVKLWSHLERQRGGAGFLGGPGETQKELDRRMISEKIIRLKKELEDVRRTRTLARKSRERVPFPVIAIVGYTNAGKSTLFNTITRAEVMAKDLLFATLDPTLRRIRLPNGQTVIISDTVGFISELPTHLIAAFRATLEQTAYADVILHVMDVANPDSRAQKADVIKTLSELGIEYETDERIIEVWNKIDAVNDEARDELLRSAKFKKTIPVSALTGQGIDSLLEMLAAKVSSARVVAQYSLPVTDGKALAWLHTHGEVIKRRDYTHRMTVQVRLEPRDIEKFAEHYGYKAAIL